MEPADLLKRAAAAVEQAKIPQDLRVIAFAKTVDLLTGRHVPSAAKNMHSGQERQPMAGSAGKSNGPLGQISSNLGIHENVIDRIFDEVDGHVVFCGDISALGTSRAERVQSLVLLLLAARRWSGLDVGSATADELIRPEVDRHGLLDVTNYTKHIAGIKPFVTISGGSGKKAVYKIKYDGLERAKEIGRQLAGA